MHPRAAPPSLARLLALALAVTACGGGDDPDNQPGDAPATPDADPTAAWAAVDRITQAAVTAEGVSGLGLAVYDADDNLVFRRMYGDFAPDREVAVASASKLVSGLVVFDLIGRGTLSLDATTGQVLGWTGPQAAITLRHLLSFTSGLAEHPCVHERDTTLAACAAEIAGAGLARAPGAAFAYGSVHLAVAARMAEVAANTTWNALFARTLAAPYGLAPSVTYYSAPRQAAGTSNPLIAGGLRASMDDYAPLLALAFHRGTFGPLTVGTPALFDAQAIEPYPDAVIAHSPYSALAYDYHYGLTAWLECATPETGCTTLSSPGAFGFTPWFDRATGYYAILGMELPRTPGDDGVVSFAVELQHQLQPEIVKALTP